MNRNERIYCGILSLEPTIDNASFLYHDGERNKDNQQSVPTMIPDKLKKF